jgi:hypothetical protein
MIKNHSQKTYSIDEAKIRLDQYLDVSAVRLRSRLKAAWKKQSSRAAKVYDKAAH